MKTELDAKQFDVWPHKLLRGEKIRRRGAIQCLRAGGTQTEVDPHMSKKMPVSCQVLVPIIKNKKKHIQNIK